MQRRNGENIAACGLSLSKGRRNKKSPMFSTRMLKTQRPPRHRKRQTPPIPLLNAGTISRAFAKRRLLGLDYLTLRRDQSSCMVDSATKAAYFQSLGVSADRLPRGIRLVRGKPRYFPGVIPIRTARGNAPMVEFLSPRAPGQGRITSSGASNRTNRCQQACGPSASEAAGECSQTITSSS